MGISNFLVIDGLSPLSFNALNHSTRAKIAFYISLENKLDIDNDYDITIEIPGGGGGGDGRRRIHFDNPGYENRFSFPASLT